MKPQKISGIVCLVVALLYGCSHKTLSFFFDGVPNPEEKKSVLPQAGSAPATAAPTRGYFEHGPYGSRQCEACHEPQTNALIAPKEELCFHCHDLKLNKKVIHGPLASGGCAVCHDPHSSPYRYLLVSDSATFCLYCHDRNEISKTEAHQNPAIQCTVCHDAHMSDKQYLLK